MEKIVLDQIYGVHSQMIHIKMVANLIQVLDHSLKWSMKKSFFENAGVGAVLEHPSLEADDCIAITVKYILDKHDEPDLKIHIITSDMDYLQLASDKSRYI